MKKIAFVILIIFISLSLCSCWSAEEPKNLAIVNSIIYDYDEDGNFTITAQIINTAAIVSSGTSTSGDKNPYVIVKGKGTSFSEAYRDITNRVEKSIFSAHNKVRFLSERVVRDDYVFKKLLDFIFRDTLTDETSLLVVVKDEDVDKVYDSSIGLAALTGNFIEELHLQKQEHSSAAVYYRTFEFAREYYEEGVNPVLGHIIFQPTVETPSLNPGKEVEDPKYEMRSEGLAMFNNLKFIGYLGGLDTAIYNIVTNNSKIAPFDIFQEEDVVSLSLSNPKSDIKVKKNGDQIDVDIKIKGQIYLSTFFVKGNSDENYRDKLKEIKAKTNEYLAQTTLDSIKKVMENGSDIYGFGKHLHMQSPSDWREISKDWETYFKNANVKVEYDINFAREGELSTPFIKES
jgi:spore germination protein KC